ncbi:MAG: RNA pseudouridine synthase [Treponema sp.]|nr:RNA pseudouridine synthase [Treponema sp.]
MAATEGFLVVYKPPLMHSAPLGEGDSLLGWCAERYPEALRPRGPLQREGGLLHRLDYGTWGLVLIARTQEALEALRRQQQEGVFVKEYGALTDSVPRAPLPGFPPAAPPAGAPATLPFAVESGFRPYGPGRKTVRPVLPQGGSPKSLRVALDQGRLYRTEILERRGVGGALYFRARIARGFRHQIRCHLSWLGHPVLGDGLYGRPGGEGALMLKAQGLSFLDPFSGETLHYQLPSILEDGGGCAFSG